MFVELEHKNYLVISGNTLQSQGSQRFGSGSSSQETAELIQDDMWE